MLAASGDSGAADVKLDESTYYPFPVTSWPDSDPLVTAVGGTQLHVTAKGKPAAPTVWNDTYNRAANEFATGNAGPNPLAGGGGRSVLFGRPGYQNGVKNVVCGHRGVPDISMSGACNGSVDTYGTFGGAPAPWPPPCGTSEATPLFAGIVALAAQVAGHSLGLVNPALYRLAAAHARGIVDVTKGDTTVSFTQGGKRHTVRGFTAVPGYDLASGVGTVNAAYFVSELAVRGWPLKGPFVPNGSRCEPWERRNPSHVSALPGYARCWAQPDLPGETRSATRPRDSARSAIVRRSSRDTLSAGGGTINAAYYVPTPAVTSRFPEEPPVPLPACGRLEPDPGGKWKRTPAR